jgi:hypothetical protein
MANVVPSSPILVTLMMEALHSSETSVLTRATLCNFPEDCILYSHRSENLKYYIALTGWALSMRRIVCPVRCELGIYIIEDGILNNHLRENVKSYKLVGIIVNQVRKNSGQAMRECIMDYYESK